MSNPRSVLLIDLNNFARYPTMSVGYLAAVLRQAEYAVRVFAPLMVGVHGVTREVPPNRFSLLAAKVNHRLATSPWAWVRRWRDTIAARRLSGVSAHHQEVLAEVKAQIAQHQPRAVLISTYLMYHDLCAQVAQWCQQQGIPLIIGGPYFASDSVNAAWSRMPGLTALVAGEVELRLPAILASVLAKGELSEHAGVLVPQPSAGTPKGSVAPPLQELDAVPFPDYTDFPWSAYPNRIVSVITGRGCSWGVCAFCSDVTSTAGRTFRSRSVANVLAELAHHHRVHSVSRFVFTDMKLNSDVAMWRGLAHGMQTAVPGSSWIAAVHVDREPDNGLSDRDLRAAARSGCVRLTTGLETGSQRLADLMKKGTRLEAISAFLHSAARAGISVRSTMILGYPGETADDVEASAEFLRQHSRVIERVSLNRLNLISGTALHRAVEKTPARFKGFELVSQDPVQAQVAYRHSVLSTAAHRRAVMGLLTEVNRINCKALSPQASAFEGVM